MRSSIAVASQLAHRMLWFSIAQPGGPSKDGPADKFLLVMSPAPCIFYLPICCCHSSGFIWWHRLPSCWQAVYQWATPRNNMSLNILSVTSSSCIYLFFTCQQSLIMAAMLYLHVALQQQQQDLQQQLVPDRLPLQHHGLPRPRHRILRIRAVHFDKIKKSSRKINGLVSYIKSHTGEQSWVYNIEFHSLIMQVSVFARSSIAVEPANWHATYCLFDLI